jgi:hypothetical protein
MIWSFAGILLGLALSASGIPISSIALFGLLAVRTQALGWPWYAAAGLASIGTVAGQAFVYWLFYLSGNRVVRFIEWYWPKGAAQLPRLRRLISSRAWPGILALLWTGVGYAQAVWLTGLLRVKKPFILLAIVVNDVVWTTLWVALCAFAADRIPGIERWLTRGSLVLLGLSVVALGWQVLAGRRRTV